MSKQRAAVVRSKDATVERVSAYLPSNYTAKASNDGVLITGTDNAGWTLDGYVIPRLASGLIFAEEITL